MYRDLEPQWSQKIDQNLLATVPADELAMSNLDPDSIMMYPIKKSWIDGGQSIGLNAKLSAKDIAFIHTIYG